VSFPSIRHPWRVLALVLLAFLVLPRPALRADDADEHQDDEQDDAKGAGPSLTSKSRETFIKIKAQLDAKNYDGVLSLLYGLEPTVKPDSYDMSVILDTEAKILWQGKNEPEKAIQPWERLLALVDQHPDYMEPADRVSHYLYLAQTYYLVSSDARFKNSPLRNQYFDRALVYERRLLAETPRPSQEYILFYCSLLYQKAVETSSKIDTAYLDQAKAEALKGLLSDPHPKEQFYILLVAIAQQENDFALAGSYLELLVVKKPTQKDYWNQLVAIYNNLAASTGSDVEHQRSYYARAINAAERAQALGFLKSPKDNFNLVSMYDQVGQFGRAIELLYGGMKNGSIEATLKNWQVLAYFYEQVDQQALAVKVLKEAEENPEFAAGGALDRQIADLYYQLDNTQGVYESCKAAVAKGNNVKNPYTTYQLLAYSAYELRKYPEALEACEKGMTYPGAPVKDLARLKEGIQDAIKQQQAEKAAAESERRTL